MLILNIKKIKSLIKIFYQTAFNLKVAIKRKIMKNTKQLNLNFKATFLALT